MERDAVSEQSRLKNQPDAADDSREAWFEPQWCWCGGNIRCEPFAPHLGNWQSQGGLSK